MTLPLCATARHLGLSALCLALALPASAQQSQVVGGAEKLGSAEEGRYVFAGVGIDAYQTEALWKPLSNAVNDVERVKATLVERYGFESPVPWVLTDDRATSRNIWDLLDALRRDLQPDDNLIFFYAGHGAEVRDMVAGEEVGRRGYLVPVDVKGPADEYPSQYVDVEHLMEGLAKVPARHVLVILDASYAGIALPPRFEMQMRGDPATGRLDQDLRSRVSRRVLTSARSDQVAADGGTRFPRNSLFTGWLVEGLERASEGREDVETPDGNRDGVITSLELYAFLESRVSRESDSRQTPAYGPFELDQRGDFMLRSRTDPPPPGG